MEDRREREMKRIDVTNARKREEGTKRKDKKVRRRGIRKRKKDPKGKDFR